MIVAGRRKSIAFFIALGAALILVTLLLYIGWVLLNWKNGILIFLSVLMVVLIISGVVLNTIFLVREIRRNAQHDAFINAVTHELKTPVASIRLYLETLQSRAVDEQRRRDFYRIMLSDSDRLLATIEQVLRTGRVGHGGRTLNRAPLDLDQVIASSLERVRAMHGVAAEAIEFRPRAPLTVLGDPDEVSAAISNLIDNAVKYSGAEVKVRIETENMEGKFACVRVIDQGPGIPKSELKQIFKRFYRVPGPQATRVKGTGLGLYIVRSVAKRHGGRAWAESDGPGHGSTFVLQLPLAKENPAPAPSPDPSRLSEKGDRLLCPQKQAVDPAAHGRGGQSGLSPFSDKHIRERS
jgi:two-component system, OmpR family, sensor histidine kinase SenX3